MRVIVVCGAGASSTFVVHRLRRAAAERGIALEARAVSESVLRAELADADVLLVGAHLEPALDAVRALAAEAGVPLAVLPETAATDDGATTLDLARSLAGAGS
ncbi:PTS IIB subunit [Agromyces mediolanus]|uniref:PTS sugar transporter subunit IIB n=1 Tax=Agromyces mediolanus TaxID=41986 RepID=UPI0038330583